MRKTHAIASSLKKEDALPAVLFAALGLTMVGLLLLCVPARALAAEEDARRGGGNALLRATTSIEHSNTASNLSARLLFASTHGGMPEDVSPPESDEDSSTESVGEDHAQNDAANEPPVQNQGNGPSTGSGQAGGATTGNGGDGGNAAPGGLIKAGSAVSNANAVNVLNTVIVRIGSNI